jgi:hypothetical protein
MTLLMVTNYKKLFPKGFKMMRNAMVWFDDEFLVTKLLLHKFFYQGQCVLQQESRAPFDIKLGDSLWSRNTPGSIIKLQFNFGVHKENPGPNGYRAMMKSTSNHPIKSCTFFSIVFGLGRFNNEEVRRIVRKFSLDAVFLFFIDLAFMFPEHAKNQASFTEEMLTRHHYHVRTKRYYDQVWKAFQLNVASQEVQYFRIGT